MQTFPSFYFTIFIFILVDNITAVAVEFFAEVFPADCAVLILIPLNFRDDLFGFRFFFIGLGVLEHLLYSLQVILIRLGTVPKFEADNISGAFALVRLEAVV